MQSKDRQHKQKNIESRPEENCPKLLSFEQYSFLILRSQRDLMEEDGVEQRVVVG